MKPLPAAMDIIPDCELLEVIGAGGAGVVYRGRQIWLDRSVAIKVLRDEQNNALVDIKRFEREARLLASLQHPAIVACHQAGVTESDTAYIVMEFVSGPNLRSYVNNHGPLSESRSIAVLKVLAEALAYANQQGIIHRDIKAENVLLEPITGDPDGFPFQPKLADLGLARQQHGVSVTDRDVTVSGAIMGSPRWMAPEQYDAPERVDHRADIYALGCLGVFLLTGRDAFRGEHFTDIVSEKLAGGQPACLREVKHLQLRQFLAKLLATKAEHRPRDYDDLLAALASLDKLEQTTRRQRPAKAGVRSVLALCMLLGLACFFYFLIRDWGGGSTPVAGPGAASPAVVAATQPEPKAPTAAAVENAQSNQQNHNSRNRVVPFGNLLRNLQTGLPHWTGAGAQHTPADSRDALILARGTITHPLPVDDFLLTIAVGKQDNLPVGTVGIALAALDSEAPFTLHLQNLGPQWVVTIAGREVTERSLMMAERSEWSVAVRVEAGRVVVSMDTQELCAFVLPVHQREAWNLSLSHVSAEGAFGAVALEAVQLDALRP